MIERVTWRGISAVLAVIGVGVAGYLTYIHYNMSVLICTPGGGCDTVQNSKYAVVGGIPVAVLGLLMYLAILAFGIIRRVQHDFYAPATMAAFAVALGGVAYAAYLTYLEIYVIHAICEWCVSSACITFLIMLLEGYGVWRILGGEDLPPEYEEESLPRRQTAANRPAAGTGASTSSAAVTTAASMAAPAPNGNHAPVASSQTRSSSSNRNRNRPRRKAKRR
ncbi:MAG TPA: vitamin K epoxide reductase family protein [Thermomicrobiaceae bacterium]|nr:vitamin K epoxide reductase family protein [Thermomicrobiaceae bacterium]